jgi:phage shock protein E
MTIWMPFAIVLALTAGYMYMKRSGQISAEEAAKHVEKGAMVIDVRSVDEFESGHLLQANNFPLDRIEMLLPGEVKDKNKALLLHCSTGVRSSMAKRKLEELGYKNVFNMGSYERASKILMGR